MDIIIQMEFFVYESFSPDLATTKAVTALAFDAADSDDDLDSVHAF